MPDLGFIDDNFVHAFENNFVHLSQETAEDIRATATVRNGVRGKTYNVERIGGVEMIEITSRHQPTQLTPFIHSRRRLTMSDYGLSEVLDDIDEVKLLVSPQSDYAAEFAKAYNRRLAQTIVNAINGNAIAVSQDDTTTNVALPAGQSIANGSTGMTVAKLRQAGRILDVNGVAAGDRTLLISPYGVEHLLRDSQITSSDYMTLNALAAGTIPNGAMVMGFRVMKVTDALGGGRTMASPILPKSANVRSCFVYHRNSVRLAIARDYETEMPKDPSIWNNLRVMVKVSHGAVRVEDEAVVKIDIDESV